MGVTTVKVDHGGSAHVGSQKSPVISREGVLIPGTIEADYIDREMRIPDAETRWDRAARIEAEKKAEAASGTEGG